MAQIASGLNSLRNTCRILGIDPDKTPIKRIVVDMKVNEASMIYIERYAHEGQPETIVQALTEKPVDDPESKFHECLDSLKKSGFEIHEDYPGEGG